MFAKSVLIIALAGSSLAAPQPQGDFLEIAKSLVSEYATARPTGTDAAQISSYLKDASSFISEFSGVPTLASSVQIALASVLPEGAETEAFCSPTAASWYSSLDRSAQVALTSYASALQTWAATKGNLGGDDEDSDSAQKIPVCSARTTQTVGGALTRASSSAATAAQTALSTSSLPGAAAPTGAIMGSIAGVVGVIGVMAAL